MGDEDGDELVIGGGLRDPFDDGLGVGDEEGGVDEDGVRGACDEGCDAREALLAGLVDVGFEFRHDYSLFQVQCGTICLVCCLYFYKIFFLLFNLIELQQSF